MQTLVYFGCKYEVITLKALQPDPTVAAVQIEMCVCIHQVSITGSIFQY